MSSIILPSLEITSWTEESLQNFTANITSIVPKPLILIDGAAGSGKTTLAEKIAGILKANLVHTDDVCWDSLMVPFLMEEKPWKYVDVIVCGTSYDMVSNNLKVHFPRVL